MKKMLLIGVLAIILLVGCEYHIEERIDVLSNGTIEVSRSIESDSAMTKDFLLESFEESGVTDFEVKGKTIVINNADLEKGSVNVRNSWFFTTYSLYYDAIYDLEDKEEIGEYFKGSSFITMPGNIFDTSDNCVVEDNVAECSIYSDSKVRVMSRCFRTLGLWGFC